MASKEWGGLYDGPEWAAHKALVIYRQNGICEDSPEGMREKAVTDHHAVYLGDHPSDTPHELCHALCWQHHMQREAEKMQLLIVFNQLLPEQRAKLLESMWPMLARSMGIRWAEKRLSPSVRDFLLFRCFVERDRT